MCTPLYNDTLRGCFTVEEKKKYLQDGVNCCGYVGGILLEYQEGGPYYQLPAGIAQQSRIAPIDHCVEDDIQHCVV